jgi:hypothetical protein
LKMWDRRNKCISAILLLTEICSHTTAEVNSFHDYRLWMVSAWETRHVPECKSNHCKVRLSKLIYKIPNLVQNLTGSWIFVENRTHIDSQDNFDDVQWEWESAALHSKAYSKVLLVKIWPQYRRRSLEQNGNFQEGIFLRI